MADILIKGLKMPKDKPISILLYPGGEAYVWEPTDMTGQKYKATVLPPHGRCIDADKLHFTSSALNMAEFDYIRRYRIDRAPTIIEREE